MLEFAIAVSICMLIVGLACLVHEDTRFAGLVLVGLGAFCLYRFVWDDHRAPIVRKMEQCIDDGFAWEPSGTVFEHEGRFFEDGRCVVP